jgi:hypothetical protein
LKAVFHVIFPGNLLHFIVLTLEVGVFQVAVSDISTITTIGSRG